MNGCTDVVQIILKINSNYFLRTVETVLMKGQSGLYQVINVYKKL
jgi:hypothetical protein